MHRKSKEIINILDPQIAAEKCNTEFIIEIENQRAGNQQRCHCAECARFEQHRAALYKHANSYRDCCPELGQDFANA